MILILQRERLIAIKLKMFYADVHVFYAELVFMPTPGIAKILCALGVP